MSNVIAFVMTVWGVEAGGSGAIGAGVAGWTAVVLTATKVEETLALILQNSQYFF
jgi:hypothetical protein